MRNITKLTSMALTIAFYSFAVNISYAEDNFPEFDCTLTDTVSANDTPGDAKDVFSKTTPKIYLICTSDEVQKGDVIKAVWIAADTHNAAPANYKIDDKEITVAKDLDDEDEYTANLSLSKPDTDWPAGSYHVDLFVNDELDQSIKFSVK